MKSRFYVTTPIYYVNDVPHIGHAYTTVAADVAARFHRLKGLEVRFLTGTDEHGQKVARAAEENGRSPQEWVDSVVPSWQQLWQRLWISNDDFIRTTESRHEQPVQEFWRRLYESGDVYLAKYEGPYCVSCEEFYRPEDLVDGKCPIHGSSVEVVSEENYFFRLSKYKDWLINEYYARTPAPVYPPARLNEVLRFAEDLQDTSVSRSSFSWGLGVPWDPKHVIYVWVEALLNYITALDYPDGELFKKFWPGIHFVGKDILRFHAVTWPAMLHAAGLDPPDLVVAHGWLLVGGEKMSKTKLTGIHPDQLIETFGVDGFRYYFLREIAFGQDGSFSWESMVARYNAELANGIGNLASRVLALLESNREGVVPDPSSGEQDPERALRSVAEKAVVRYDEALERFAFNEGLEAIDAIVREANQYLVQTAPWKLAKEPSQRARVDAILYTAAETLRLLAVLLSPFTPGASGRLWTNLGIPEGLDQQRLPAAGRWGGLKPGTRTSKGDPLFPRVDA
ncbi:MAG: methionine--tRNA ligase [Actinomycetota bacterium]